MCESCRLVIRGVACRLGFIFWVVVAVLSVGGTLLGGSRRKRMIERMAASDELRHTDNSGNERVSSFGVPDLGIGAGNHMGTAG